MKFIKKAVKFWQFFLSLLDINVRIDDIKINQGIILSALNRQIKSSVISDYEFKIFSQWGEDGIIQYLTESIEIKNKTFIEFGVQDFSESNCRFLMMKDNWKGFVIDGSEHNIEKLRRSYYYWKYHLLTKCTYIKNDNINGILKESGFDEDLGILSIDIDGVDYFVLEAINEYKPRILIVEFNPLFGIERKISVPYRSDFHRTKAHHSNLYFGASLPAIVYLADKKGYSLVGVNTMGGNAFFVKVELLNDKVKRQPVSHIDLQFHCRESRDINGNLNYLAGNARFDAIKGMPVINVETEQIESL
jgi:hypothetical protein